MRHYLHISLIFILTACAQVKPEIPVTPEPIAQIQITGIDDNNVIEEQVEPEATATPEPIVQIQITDIDGNSIIEEDDDLVANIISDPTGSKSYSFKWFRNGIWIDGPTGSTLSNEEMKTFTGLSEEYTPKSNHTDHAIRGYLFEVVVFNENMGEIGSSSITISGPIAKIEMRGMNFATWESRLTSNGKGKNSLQAMKTRLNPNWVSIWTIHYQDGINATTIYALDSGDPSTISDKETIEQINAAHELGLKVVLYPQIWLYTPESGGTPGNREEIVPTEEWFNSYKEFILHQADIAEQTNVELFVIGVELWKTESHTDQWIEIIDSVRNHYSGPITYSAIMAEKNAIERAFSYDWFFELDYIGISTNFEFQGAGNDATLSEAIELYESYEIEIEKLSEYFDKPIIILESSTSSVDGALQGIHFIEMEDIPDHQEQADYFEAFLRVFGNKSYIKGIFWNQWLSSQETWYSMDAWWFRAIEVVGKPAERVLSSWYGGQIP